MLPTTEFLDAGGRQIAYQVHGSGPDVVWVVGLGGHVDLRWTLPAVTRTADILARFARTITFDRAGTGASGRAGPGAVGDSQSWADDLLRVLDAVDSERAWLMATQDGAHLAMAFAARYSDRTHGLILANAAVKFVGDETFPQGVPAASADWFVNLVTEHWGTVEMAKLLRPTEPSEWDAHALLQRASCTPQRAGEIACSIVTADAREIADAISVPTFIFHRADHDWVSPDLGRDLAERIAGSTFMELPGKHALMQGPDAAEIIDRVARIITGLPAPSVTERRLAAILFTDIVSSTERTVSEGDRRWKYELTRHDDICRQIVELHGGTVATSTGDGVVAIFVSATRAVEAALDLRDGLARVGLTIRSGIHVGEIDVKPGDVAGLAVPTAQRIQSVAHPDSVFMSQIVVDLIESSRMPHRPVGSYKLKGVPGEWLLHEAIR